MRLEFTNPVFEKYSVEKIYFFISLFLVFCIQMLNIDGYILDQHGFRQTQTAITTAYFLKEGFSFAYLTPVFGWPWSLPFEFPTYQYIVYLVAAVSGAELEPTGRVVNLFFFYMSLIVFFKVLSLIGLKKNTIYLILIFVVLSPIYVFWSRTFMIESTALFFSMVTFYLFLKLHRDGFLHNKLTLLLLLLFASIAALTKVTTFLSFSILLFLYFIVFERKFFLSRSVLYGSFVFLVSISIAILYTHYGDALKSLNPIAEFVTSHNLRAWNFGTIDARMLLDNYITIGKHLMQNQGLFLLVLFLVPGYFVFVSRDRGSVEYKLALVSLLVFIISFMVLFNLFKVHNYYWYSNSFLLSTVVALVVATLLERVGLVWKNVILMGVLLMGFLSYYDSYYKVQIHNFADDPVVLISDVIKHYTNENDIVYIRGRDWSSEVPYYSERKSIMIPGWRNIDVGSQEFDSILEKSLDEQHKIGALVLCGLNDEGIKKRLDFFKFSGAPVFEGSGCVVYTRDKPHNNDLLFNAYNIIGPLKPRIEFYKGKNILWAHIGTTAKLKLPTVDKSHYLDFSYGVKSDAYRDANNIQGACFRISSTIDSSIIWEKCIFPKSNPKDRGFLQGSVSIPDDLNEVLLETLPVQGGSSDWGHTFWSDFRVH